MYRCFLWVRVTQKNLRRQFFLYRWSLEPLNHSISIIVWITTFLYFYIFIFLYAFLPWISVRIRVTIHVGPRCPLLVWSFGWRSSVSLACMVLRMTLACMVLRMEVLGVPCLYGPSDEATTINNTLGPRCPLLVWSFWWGHYNQCPVSQQVWHDKYSSPFGAVTDPQ